MHSLVTLILTFSLREKELRATRGMRSALISLSLRERAWVRVNRFPAKPYNT
jgi:hypothetical protein